jgi:hypothetical protein
MTPACNFSSTLFPYLMDSTSTCLSSSSAEKTSLLYLTFVNIRLYIMLAFRPRERLAEESGSEVMDSTTITSKPWPSNPTTTWKLASLHPEYHNILLPGNLRRTAAWIRDILEPKVACEGPDVLLPDDVLTIHMVFLALQNHHVSQYLLRFSRIHLAVTTVCGRATRWPSKLVDEADRVIAHLEMLFGSLKHIKVQIFGAHGRLSGICDQTDITRDVRILRTPVQGFASSSIEAASLFSLKPSQDLGLLIVRDCQDLRRQ